MASRLVVRRRRFLELGIAAAAGSMAACGGGQRRFLTLDELQTVDAICEQFIPADQDPGARAAGVVNYIDTQLAGRFKKHREAYQKGIAAVNAASVGRFGKPFAALPFDQQTGLLRQLEKPEARFFSLILQHTMQGFYGDPRHGGNRGCVSWKMLGVPFPPVRGRQHYEISAG
jgi:gluconate 2-dehydrogenase gamma chain